MATRKKKEKVGRVDEEGHLCFAREDLMRYELAQARLLNSMQAIRLKKYEIEDKRREMTQALQRMGTEVTGLRVTLKQHEEELRMLQDELGKAYGVDLSKVSYDDVTGRITLDGEPVLRE